jgi:amino acid adenylation domain-containing protein/thioester reductase-like protein
MSNIVRQRQATYIPQLLTIGEPIGHIDAYFAAQLPWPQRARASEAEVATLASALTPELSQTLRQLHALNPLTAPVVLITAYSALLARYADEPTLALGVRHTAAQQPDLTAVELQPLTVSADLTFAELSEQIVNRLDAPHTSDTAFDSDWSFSVHYHAHQSPTPIAQPPSASDLHLALTETDRGLDVGWFYRAERFSATTIARMHDHFVTLVEAAIVNAQQSVMRLPLLTPAELEQQLVSWNATTTPYPDQDAVYTLIERHARQTPAAVALRFQGEQLSYAALNARANQLARHLRNLGVQRDVVVAIGVERSFDLMIAILAVLKAGGIYLPLDPSYPTERLAFMLADAQAPVLITTAAVSLHTTLATNDDQRAEQPPQVVVLEPEWPLIAQQPEHNLDLPIDPDQTGYMIYTSGSTGRPKGALLAHRGLCSLVVAHQQLLEVQPNDRILQFASCSFDASIWEWVMALGNGATLCLTSQDVINSTTDLHALLRAERISIVTLPPSLLRVLPHTDLDDLRILITAGEACTPELITRWAAGRRFINAYGPTETTICASWYECTPHERTTPPIGRPLPNMQLYVLDQHQQPVPNGVIGELYVGGFALAQGYWNRPELTAERFVRWYSPLTPTTPTRLYRTGDLVRYRADGNVEFLGRLDHQVKLRGFRVELAEIDALVRQMPGVRESIVLLREDAPGLQRLVTYLALDTPPTDDAAFRRTLRARLSEQLPAYMVPSAYVIMPAFPLMPNGKVDRRALPHPLPTDEISTMTPPRNEQEAKLAQIWAEVLGRPSIGIDDDFFALGGHSLLTAQLSARVGAALSRAVPLTLIYEAPTIAAFAAALNGRSHTEPVSSLDLHAEVVLDPAISPPTGHTRISTLRTARAIFLTGATGFLGAFLLRALLERTNAQIYCLVRAKSSAEAAARLTHTLELNQIDVTHYHSRITPVPGDLREHQFGLDDRHFQQLAASIDSIYHAGAHVHYLHNYAALRSANVGGTVEVLRLACTDRLKPVNYISSIAVAIANGAHDTHEDAELHSCASSVGYDQSKWVAEGIVRLAQRRGVPVAVYRPGRIGAHSSSGVVNRDDLFVRLLAGCVQLGGAPDVAIVDNLAPVDYVAQAIVALSGMARTFGKTFNILNPRPLDLQQTAAQLHAYGLPLRVLPYEQWYAALRTAVTTDPSSTIASLALMLPEHPDETDWLSGFSSGEFDMRNTSAGLAATDVVCPVTDAAYVARMIANAARQGLVQLPQADPEPRRDLSIDEPHYSLQT